MHNIYVQVGKMYALQQLKKMLFVSQKTHQNKTLWKCYHGIVDRISSTPLPR